MIVEKCSPALARWPSRFRHVLCHRGLADIDPELEQFTMDTGRTPKRVCDAHLANKLTNLSWGSWPTAPGSRFQAPVSPKAVAMPPVPKTTSGRNDDEDHPGSAVTRRVQFAGSRDVAAHLCPMIGASEFQYNSARSNEGSDVNAKGAIGLSLMPMVHNRGVTTA